MRKAILFVLFTTATLAQSRAVDWDRQRAETLAHYRALVQLDTSNPPGNETRVVEYLSKVLTREGIAFQTFALEPGRANRLLGPAERDARGGEQAQLDHERGTGQDDVVRHQEEEEHRHGRGSHDQ